MESVRLRSVPVQPEAVALPRRAAVLGGRVDADRATAHAYVVFAHPEHAQAALAHNMQVVRPWSVLSLLSLRIDGQHDGMLSIVCACCCTRWVCTGHLRRTLQL